MPLSTRKIFVSQRPLKPMILNDFFSIFLVKIVVNKKLYINPIHLPHILHTQLSTENVNKMMSEIKRLS